MWYGYCKIHVHTTRPYKKIYVKEAASMLDHIGELFDRYQIEEFIRKDIWGGMRL